MQKKKSEKFFVLKILEKFCVSLKETFSSGNIFTVINKSCKGAVTHIATFFRPICLLLCLRVLCSTAFFPEYISYEGHLFWNMFKVYHRF